MNGNPRTVAVSEMLEPQCHKQSRLVDVIGGIGSWRYRTANAMCRSEGGTGWLAGSQHSACFMYRVAVAIFVCRRSPIVIASRMLVMHLLRLVSASSLNLTHIADIHAGLFLFGHFKMCNPAGTKMSLTFFLNKKIFHGEATNLHTS